MWVFGASKWVLDLANLHMHCREAPSAEVLHTEYDRGQGSYGGRALLSPTLLGPQKGECRDSVALESGSLSSSLHPSACGSVYFSSLPFLSL